MTFLRRTLDRPLRISRGFALKALSTTGATRVCLNSSWRQQRLAILCYHGISKLDEHLWRPSLYITRDRLASRLGVLKKLGCAVMPLSVAVQQLRKGDLPPRAVALTFDDGAHDFLSEALPVLQEYSMPSTTYVATYYSDRPTWPVFTVGLSYILWRSRNEAAISSSDFGKLCGAETIALREQPEKLTQHLIQRTSEERWSGADKQTFLERLAAIVHFDLGQMIARRQLCLMSQTELASLPESVDLQLHTHTHVTPHSESALREELDRNRERLTATGRMQSDPFVHFCYPSGIVQEGQPAWLANCGIESATTCEVRLASREDDPFLLPRIVDTTTMREFEFENWIAGPRQFLRAG